jgi:hypothetical protein
MVIIEIGLSRSLSGESASTHENRESRIYGIEDRK